MLSRRRTNDLIISEILRACRNGATKTRIVYQANLNFLTVKPYLDNLTKKGFIEALPEGSRIVYKTTLKGHELEERFERFHSEMEKLYTSGSQSQTRKWGQAQVSGSI
jgi:predicted transcriptional regulator